jgi:DNA-binding transcriptional regulator GbsR (MarR family)
MSANLQQSRDIFILGMSRISHFWGFPKAMGAIYGAVYLAPEPISLDELVELTNVTKGAVSTNVRSLERLGMVHHIVRIGERKDYYTAETDFWKVIRGILREREKSEFDRSLRSVDESLALLDASPAAGGLDPAELELAGFYRQRMQAMQSFFRSLDQLVALVMAFDDLRAGALQKLLGRAAADEKEKNKHV